MVKHVLRDGQTVKSIDGHVVKDAQAVYALMERINKEASNGN